jgi:hypothetical protein
MVSPLLGDTTLESLTPSVNTPLVYKIPDDVMQSLWECKVLKKRAKRLQIELKRSKKKDRAGFQASTLGQDLSSKGYWFFYFLN